LKAKFILLGCAGSIVFCLGVGGLSSFVFTKQARDSFANEIAQAKKDGLPTTFEAYSAPIDPSKNSAPALVAAAKALADQAGDLAKKSKEPQKKVLKLWNKDWNRSVVTNASVLQPAIAKLTPSLDSAVEASKLPGFRIGRDTSWGFDVIVTESIDLKYITKWLSVRAILRAHSGDDAGVAEDLTAMARISAFCGSDDSLIGYMVQVATEDMTLQAMEQCLSASNGRPGTIRAVRQALKTFAPVLNIKTALRGEYYKSLVGMQETIKLSDPRFFDVFTTPEARNSPSVWSRLMMSHGMLESNVANLLRVTRETYQALPDDPLDLAAAEAVFAANDKKLAAEANNNHYILARSILPVFPDAPKAFVRSAQQRRLLEVLVVSLEERNRTGRLPAKLPVKGALATDLFDGGKLRYSLVDGKLKIYSVGIDGFDNGGAQPTDGNTKDIDIVVSFPR
jgi:hypothetical protein